MRIAQLPNKYFPKVLNTPRVHFFNQEDNVLWHKATDPLHFNYATPTCPSPRAGWALREWWSLWELRNPHILKCCTHEATWPSSGLGQTPRFKSWKKLMALMVHLITADPQLKLMPDMARGTPFFKEEMPFWAGQRLLPWSHWQASEWPRWQVAKDLP